MSPVIEIEAVLVEPVLSGRVVAGGEQILQHENLVGAALLLDALLLVAVPERRLRSLVDVGETRPSAVAVAAAAVPGLFCRAPDVSVRKLDGRRRG